MHTVQEQRLRSTSHLSLTHAPAGDSSQKPCANGHLDNVTSRPTSTSFCRRLRSEPVYRRKVEHTVWLGWAFFFLGWSIGIFGPAFPDLRLLINEDLETSTWLFTSGYFGYLLGSLLGGWFFDRYNKLLTIFLSVFGISLTNSLVPFCSSLRSMLVVMFLCGGFEGSLETGGNADVMAVWGSESSTYILAIYCAYSAGGIISPIVTQPFLASEVCLNKLHNNGSLVTQVNLTEANSSDISHSSTFNLYISLPNANAFPVNVSNSLGYYDGNITTNNLGLIESQHVTTSPCEHSYGPSSVHIPFILAGVFSLSAAIPFLVLYCASRRHTNDVPEATLSRSTTPERPTILPLKMKVICLFVISSIMCMYCATEDNLTGLLMTFSISHLGWSKSHGSIATSLNWTAFAFGRFITMFLVRSFKLCTLLNFYFAVLVISVTGLLLSSVYHVTYLIWIFIPLVGFALSVIMPVMFAWTEVCILPVSGKISSLYLVCGSAGSMLTPLLFGYLMEEYTPLWYVYLLLVMCVLSAILYGVTRCVVVFYIQPYAAKTRIEEKENVCSLLKDDLHGGLL